MTRDTPISEIEWWDRAAMGVELLMKKAAFQNHRFVFNGDVYEWIGNGLRPPYSETAMPPVGMVYSFENINDSEILRRLTQMPDETPMDMLIQPFVLFCPEIKTLLSVNAPSSRLEINLKKLKELSL